MPDIFDYFNWRGDLNFKNDKFNTIDALILSRLSYLPFDNIVSDKLNESITIKKAADKLFENDNYKKSILWKGDEDLLKYAASNPRFKNLKLFGYVNIIASEEQMQFSALIIKLKNDLHYISFRGTDNTIVGWQEDFNMYYMFPLPSQLKAVEYLNNLAKNVSGKFILGGHSKGGNLAVYASAFCEPSVQNRITDIYNHDGPGFDTAIIEKSEFQAIKNKIHTFMPQSSIFGMMFEHEEDFIIVKSNQKGFLQHDIYSWEVDRTRLVELNKMTNTSIFFDNTIKQFIARLSIDERKKFIEAVFDMFKDTENETFDEILDHLIKNSGTMLKSLKNMDNKTRKLIFSTLAQFIKCAKNNFSDINPLRKENRDSARKRNKSKRITSEVSA